MNEKTFCWRIRNDFVRQVQLTLGKQHLWVGSDVRMHRNTASFHVASRRGQSHVRRKCLTAKPKQGGRKMPTRNAHHSQQAKRSRGDWQSWALQLIRKLYEGQNDSRAIRDKKSQRRPENKSLGERRGGEKYQEKTMPVILIFKNTGECLLSLLKDISYTLNLRLLFLFNKTVRVTLMWYNF